MESFSNELLRGIRRVLEKPQLAMGVMIVAVVLALIKARGRRRLSLRPS